MHWLSPGRVLFFGCALLACCSVTVAQNPPGGGGSRPNILFVMADDHGYQAISAYGSKINRTPNIDRLAKEGMRFDRCFVTNSVCGPSRAVILTGKYSHLNGFTTNAKQFNGAQQTVAKLLQAGGYTTALIGKWHLGTDPTGFDHWSILQGQGPYYNPGMKTPGGVVKHTGYTTDIITDQVLEWLDRKRDKSKPFLLMYQHKAPHRNWQPPLRHLDNYKHVTIPEPANLFDDYQGRGTPARENQMSIARHLTPYDLKLEPPRGLNPDQAKAFQDAYAEENKKFAETNPQGDDRTRWNYQRFVKDYLRCVDAIDDNLGRVLKYLDDSGLAQNTVVIYTSDQGWYLGEHGWYDKRWMYEESFRTPFLVRWPGKVKPGSVNKDLVMNLDFAETFLEIAGLPIPEDMQGRSLVPILKGQTPSDWRKSIYYHYYEFPQPHHVHPHYGIRTDKHKLIHFYTINEWELYDLEKDPHEMQSRYMDPAYEKVVGDLKRQLEELRKQYRDDGTVAEFDWLTPKP